MQKFNLPRKIDHYLALLSRLYEREGQKQKQEIIVNSRFRVDEEWVFDNWDGGTYGHALYLIMPEVLYLDAVGQKEKLQNEISTDINKLHNVQNEFIAAVFLEVSDAEREDRDWRRASGMLLSGERAIPLEAERRIWTDQGFRLFLSHKAEIKKKAADLKIGLEVFGISSFVAHDDIHPTKEWQTEIESALFSMDALVALMTKGFHDSEWTDQELGVAFGRDVPIISLRLGKDPYGFIGKFQALSCPLEEAPMEIAKILIRQEKMRTAYVGAVKKCRSFEQGNTLSELLPFIDKLSNDDINGLISAFNENVEVRGSFGFNGTKPSYYGNGLLFHLRRIGGREYKELPSGKIQVKM